MVELFLYFQLYAFAFGDGVEMSVLMMMLL